MNAKAAGVLVLVVLVAAGLVYVYLEPMAGTTTEGPTSSTTSFTQSLPNQDWLTYHADNSRSGSVAFPNFTSASLSWKSAHLDGQVYAEPLIFRNAVIVATENDSVYSLNASSGQVLWRTNLGPPVAGSALPCGDIDPTGITGTPVIDPSTGLIYVVAFLSPPHHVLFAIGAEGGKILFQLQADPPGADPTVQQQRSALSLANGFVYIPYGGLFGDCGDYHGWVVGLKADGEGAMVSYQVPTGREGGIWATSGAVVDSAGNLYVATGNGASSTTFDHGDSVIKLSPTLAELGFFAPSNWSSLNSQDLDLGTAGPVLASNGTLFQIGKEGVGYLLNASSLGGIGGALSSTRVCDGAYGALASSKSVVFIPCTNGLFAVRVTGTSFSVAWESTGFFAGPPIVIGNTVWTVDRSGVLHVFTTEGTPMFTLAASGVAHFVTPSCGAGRVFVAAGGQVLAFGVT